MIRAALFATGSAIASAAFASKSDVLSVYEQFASELNISLTEEEKAFHIEMFEQYALETANLQGSSLVDSFLESMPAITAARASEIAESAAFETDASSFARRTVRDVKRLMGVKKPITPLISSEAPEEFPKAFSVAQAHPECPMVTFARDQGNCGSCWAMAVVGAFNDRECIATGGDAQKLLSTQYLTSCFPYVGSCEGGWPDSAWLSIKQKGIPSGGEFEDVDSGETCYPYFFHKCAHHMKSDTLEPCSKSDVAPDGQRTPKCSKECTSKKYPKALKDDLHFVDEVFQYRSVADVKKTLIKEGSVVACYDVYEDFLLYKGGVYRPGPRKGSVLGGHAVKVIGWGVDEHGVEYWEAVNSWNEQWGENGGRFRVGLKEGIFGEFTAGTAKATKMATEATERM